MTILYPLSPSHSGSTLLSLMVGAQEGIHSSGELFLFSSRPIHIEQKENLPCSCNGLLKENCPFWQKVEAYLSQNYGFTLDELDLESNVKSVLQEHNAYLFDAISKASGEVYILDNSKVVSLFMELLVS